MTRHCRSARVRSALAAACVVTASLAFVSCKGPEKDTPPEARATAGPVDATPLPSGPRLASLPVFPQTDAPLAVVRTQPEDGSADVLVGQERARIVVQFNHPVVPLVGFEDQAKLPVPITVEPEVTGKGAWLNTSTYMLTPSENLRAGTQYTVRVTDQLTDVLGARLPAEHRFAFTTAAPYVVGQYPDGGTTDVSARTAVSVTFSQGMDRASTQRAFSLRTRRDGTGSPVAGAYRWLGDRTLVFQPAAPLDRDANYLATIAAGALDASGKVPTRTEDAWSFTTVKAPGVYSTRPENGAEGSTWLREHGFEIQFGAPMNEERLEVTIQPTITNQSHYLGDNGRTAYVSGGWLASQRYTVRIHGESPTRDGEPLGQDTVVSFSVAPMESRAWIETPSDRSFLNGYVPARAYVGAVNQKKVGLNLASVTPADALTLLRDYDDPEEWPGKPIRAWTVENDGKLDAFRYVSTTLSTSPDGLLAPGVYTVRVGDQHEVLQVSKVNLALKTTDREALVWATDLKSGLPVPNQPIRVFDGHARLLTEGRTDADGVFRGRFEPLTGDRLWDSIQAISVVGDQVVAATGTSWSNGIQPYEFNLPYTRGAQAFYGHVYTDRPIYRPGQSVYFRGVARADDDAVYSLPPTGHTVRLTARDGDGKLVFETDAPVGEYGTFSGEVPLSVSAPLGYYSVQAILLKPQPGPTATPRPTPEGESARERAAQAERERIEKDIEQRTVWTGQAEFQVAAYRKPEYEVEVKAEQDAYAEGETVRVGAGATYYFGGPVADARVHWRLISDDYFFPQPEAVKGWWDWIDYDLTESRYWNPEGGVIRDGEAKLDADGRVTLETPGDLGDKPLSQLFTFDVEVTDINGQAVSQRGEAVVHKADLYLGLHPREYLAKRGVPVGVDVLSVNSQGVTVTNKAVDLAYYEREWYSVKEKREDGRFYWTSKYTDTLLSKQTVTTDARGAAAGRFTPPEPGVYRVTAQAKDQAGRPARSATYVWTWGDGFTNWRQENNDRLQLVADKKEYMPGDTARILVPAPFAGAEALVTTERGSIRSVRRVSFKGNSETLEIPLTETDAPNLFVSVMLVKGTGPDSPVPQFKLGYASLPVSIRGKILDVRVQPDKAEHYQPGETVTYTVRAADRLGQPVQAELSLALVDKAILALRPESGPTLRDAFYGQRELGVGTAASLNRSLDRLNAQLAAEKKGGGGGLPAPGGVRRVFRDTAYWNAAVVTDPQGQAQVAVKLPDNLTTWTLTAHGVTGADTRVGTGRVEIVSSKDLMLRPALPRFAVVGDRLKLSAVVNNATDKDVDAEVALAVEGLAPQGQMVQKLRLPARGKGAASFEVAVPATGLRPPALPEALGEAVVKLHVGGGGLEDAVELPFPVYRFTAPATVGTSGVTEGRVEEAIQLPADVTTDQGELKVSLSPSLAAASTNTLTWLKTYPYDCAEQTVSKFLPNTATFKALTDLGLERPELKAELEREIALQAQRLAAFQREDGGWGWWSGSPSASTWITAYAVFALGLARDAGFPIDAGVLERGRGYLFGAVDGAAAGGADWRLSEQAMALFALAETGELSPSRSVALYEKRGRLDTSGRAFLALALAKAVGAQDPRVKGLLADIQNAAAESATGRHWEDDEDGRYYGSTGTRATAVALLALARLRPDDPGQPNIVRWLMSERTDEHWASTQDTAWSLLGLTEVMRNSGELKGRFRWDALLNDGRLDTGTVDKDNVDRPRRLTAKVADLRTDAANRLVIQKQGQGRLYYTAHLDYYRPAAGAPPVDAGIVLGREYLQVDPRTLKPTGKPIEDVRVGDYVQVRLTMILPNSLDYVMLEDPLPAGFEAVDTSLRTTTSAASGPQMHEVQPEGAAEEDAWWGYHWWSYWVDSQLRDEKAAVFADWLGPGTYEYTYLIRAGLAGEFNVIPATAQAMYFPEVFGRSAGGVLSVAPAP